MCAEFKVNRRLFVTSSIAACESIRLAPNDYCGGLAHQIDVYFCYALRGQLDEEKFVTATEQLLLSFPALGASLDFTGVPALDMRNITLPLSFASWPGGSVQDLLGPQNASKRLPFGISLCDTIKTEEIGSLFKLRATALGDGNTILAASWLHILGDGASIGRCMQWLAIAYQGLVSGKTGETILPLPKPERPFWPWQLKDCSPHEDQALLDTASGYFGLKAQSKETLQLASSKSEEEETFSVNIGISKVDLARLKQASLNQAGSKLIPYLSSNDVIMGLAWMLNNEAKNKARPGQGPAGTISVAIIGVDLGRNGLPGNLQHQSTLANLSKATTLVADSDGSLLSNPNDDAALIASLARAADAIRKGILQVRETGAISLLLESSNQIQQSNSSSIPSPDSVLTSWVSLGHDKVDFGSGVLGFYGYFGYVPSPVIILPDGENAIIRISSLSHQEANVVLSSATLNLLSNISAFLVPC